MNCDISNWVYHQIPEAFSFLEQLVNINSHTDNSEGVNKVQALLAKELSALGFVVELLASSGPFGDNLAAVQPAPGQNDVLLLVHSDTVHPPDSNFNAYSSDHEKAYGPGVLDMKSGIVVMLWALKALKELGILQRLPLRVLAVSDEEKGSAGSLQLLQEHCKQSRAALVFEWGRAGNNIITRRKGLGSFVIKVQGQEAHAGNAHQDGANAIEQLCHSILAIQKFTDYKKGITVNTGLISGGSAANTVPGHAEAKFEIRAVARDSFEITSRAVKKAAKQVVVNGTSVEITQLSYMPPLEHTDQSEKLFKAFQACGKRAGLEYGTVPGIIGGGSSANWAAAFGLPCLDGLGPYGSGAHSDQEYIELVTMAPKILNLVYWLVEQAP